MTTIDYLAETALSDDLEELEVTRLGFGIFALSEVDDVVSIGFRRRRFFPRRVLRRRPGGRRRSFGRSRGIGRA